MRASPAFQITIRRFGAWRALVVLLLVSATASTLMWWLTRRTASWSEWHLALLVASAALVGAAARMLACAPLSLRWDTQAWWLGPARTAGEEPWRGRLAVALDFGGWMLLKFERDAMPWPRRVMWLPVQTSGLEGQWHALRCAVYSARPAEGHGGPHAAIRPESKE